MLACEVFIVVAATLTATSDVNPFTTMRLCRLRSTLLPAASWAKESNCAARGL
jgi:hypothetical protein